MKKINPILFTLLAIMSFKVFAEDSEVKIPLSKYMELSEKQKTQPITVIEEVSLKGDYRNSNFQITMKGRAVAPWKKENILGAFEGHIRNCVGTAILAQESGNYQILPQSTSFNLTCKIQPKNKNLTLGIYNTLYFESQVANAESNVTESSIDFRQVSIFEKLRENENKQKADIIAKANYKITVLPDNSKFYYQFTINNPNRATQKFSISLLNNEIIEGVGTNLKYEDSANSLQINVPSGEHFITAYGKINGASFKPLLKSEEQYLLIQNHPLMQVQPTTNWRRIATSESAMSQEYNSARAFLIDPRESISWSAKKLQAFTALGYTLKNAHYLYYVARDGKAIVEATYNIANQGTPEISLEVPGTALYMAVDGQASPLYKDDKGALLVSIPSGEHSLVIQYQPDSKARTLASVVNNQLLKPNAVVSQSTLNLRFDNAWKMIVGRFGDDISSNINFSDIFYGIFIGFLFFLILKKLYRITDNKMLYTLSGIIGVLSFFGGIYNPIIFVSLLFLSVWRYREWIVIQLKKFLKTDFTLKKTIFTGVALLGAFVVIFFLSVFSSIFSQRYSNVAQRNYGNYKSDVGNLAQNYASSAEEKEMLDAAAPTMTNKMLGEGASGGGSFAADKRKGEGSFTNNSESYEGLPAKVEIPTQGTNEYFDISLIDASKQLKVSSFFIKGYFFAILDTLLLLALAFTLYRNRKNLMLNLMKTWY